MFSGFCDVNEGGFIFLPLMGKDKESIYLSGLVTHEGWYDKAW